MRKSSIPFKLTAIRLRQLQLFERAAELGSISEAARQLNISQPAATEMLKGLERAFSAQLFVGTTRGILLTEQGKRVASRTSLALRELQLAITEASSEFIVGEVLRVGLAPPTMYSDLPLAIKAFTEANPQVLLNMREFNVAESVHALQEDEVDVVITANDPAFIGDDAREKFFVRPLWSDHYTLFLNANVDLGEGWEPTAENLRNLSWILPTKESFVRGMLDDWFLSRGVAPPESYIELTPLTLAIQLMRTFPYTALLPSGLTRRGAFKHLVPLAHDMLTLPIRLVMACRESQLNRPAVSGFVDQVVATCGSED